MGFSANRVWNPVTQEWEKQAGTDGTPHVLPTGEFTEVIIALAAGNGIGSAVDISDSLAAFRNQTRTLFLTGTFGGAQVTIEVSGAASPVAADWVAIPGADLITVPSVKNVEINALWIRATIAGGTGTAITIRLL